MYGALWRVLPGPIWLRIIILIVMLGVVLTLLLMFVFPWLDGFVNAGSDVTVQQ
jgi:hypothetical protein